MIDYVIIPARGGSKRIPQKNLALFNDKKMLEIAVDLAKEVSKNIIISSEDSKILDVAKNLNVNAFKRSEKLADDFTPTLPVIIDVIKNCNVPPDSSVLCLYATAMFVNKSNIIESMSLLKHTNAPYIVSIVENSKIVRSFTLQDSRISFMFKEFMHTRSQDLPKTYNDAGQFYLGYAKSFLDEIPLLSNKSVGLEISMAWDIDTQKDLEIAQIIYNTMCKNNHS